LRKTISSLITGFYADLHQYFTCEDQYFTVLVWYQVHLLGIKEGLDVC